MKGILAKSRFALLNNQAATGAAGDDLILNEIDVGTAQNGTLILIVDNAASSDVTNVNVWTSVTSDFLTSGMAGSDTTAATAVVVKSDTSNLAAEGILGASLSDLTVSTNTIATISEDGMYAVNIKDLKRYVNVSYTSAGAGGSIAAAFVGHDLMKAQWEGARTAY